jgi:hypothetical protein
VAQNNKTDGVNVTPITEVDSIDPELLKNLMDMEKIDADSVDDCTDESVMEYLESTQERSASVTAEYFKAEVLAKVSFSMSEKDPGLRVTKKVADYYSLHRNLILDYINGKLKKAVDHLVPVIKPATLRALIESKLEIDMSELKKNFLEFVGHVEKMVFCRPDQCRRTSYVVDNSCLISEQLASLFLHDDFASRHLHIQMLRNDYTVPTRCRHRGKIVDALGCQACRAIR